MTPQERYYAGLPPTDLGDIDATHLGEIDDPGAAARAQAYFNEINARGTPTRDLGELGGPPVSQPVPFSWNAPGYENAAPAPRAALGNTRDTRDVEAPLAGPVGSIEEPGAHTAAAAALPMPAAGQTGGTPSFARAPAQPDTAPAQASASPEAQRAAAALAHYGGTGGRPSGGGGGGGGAPAGPSELRKAQGALLGTFDAEREGLREVAGTERVRAGTMAEGNSLIAQRKIRDQEIQEMEAQNAARHFEDYSVETQRQIDDVRAKRIQPNRAYSDTGSAALAIIGGMLGGLYQGLNKLEKNPFIEQMNKTMDRDIWAQEQDLRTQKSGIADRKSLLADMRATYKDEALAKAQAKNLYIEGAREALAAEAGKFDSPTIAGRWKQADAALDRMKESLNLDRLMKEAAERRAAAGAAAAREKEKREWLLKVDEHNRKWFDSGVGADKAHREKGSGDVGRFVGTGKDEQGNPTGYLAGSAEIKKERENARVGTASLITKIDTALDIRSDEGPLGRTLNRADPNQPIQLYSPEWQTKIRGLKAEMLTDWAHAKKLGVLSSSDRELGDAAIGDLESRGDKGDVSLRQLKSLMQKALDAEADETSGARATKVVEGGHERVIMHGSSNAPTNRIAGPRTPVGR